MKKFVAILLALSMVLAFAVCGAAEAPVEVMTHEQFIAAELDTPVCIETAVQAHQSWWDGKITVYAQSEDGAYFLYNMACSEEDAEKLLPGTMIRVNGYKAEWSGEVEIIDATFEIIEGEYIAESADVTDLLGTEELAAHQNEFVYASGLTVSNVEFKNGEPGDDIYVSFTKGDVTLDFCVEAYLTGPDTELYEAVSILEPGDVVDVEGFLYWYNGANMHITGITFHVMDHAEYVAAELDSEVVLITSVQAHQSWWDGKITVYAQSEDGAYFIYNMACTEEDAALLVPGTEILVIGYKSEWSGEVEIVDAEFMIWSNDGFVAEAADVTDLLGTDALIDHQNEFITAKGLTVASVTYKNNEPGDDIYVSFTKGDVTLDFCVEAYLTGPDTDVYAAVGALQPGDVVDIEGFLYWYNGANAHITSVVSAQ